MANALKGGGRQQGWAGRASSPMATEKAGPLTRGFWKQSRPTRKAPHPHGRNGPAPVPPLSSGQSPEGCWPVWDLHGHPCGLPPIPMPTVPGLGWGHWVCRLPSVSSILIPHVYLRMDCRCWEPALPQYPWSLGKQPFPQMPSSVPGATFHKAESLASVARRPAPEPAGRARAVILPRRGSHQLQQHVFPSGTRPLSSAQWGPPDPVAQTAELPPLPCSPRRA